MIEFGVFVTSVPRKILILLVLIFKVLIINDLQLPQDSPSKNGVVETRAPPSPIGIWKHQFSKSWQIGLQLLFYRGSQVKRLQIAEVRLQK